MTDKTDAGATRVATATAATFNLAYESAALKALPQGRRPNPMTVCEFCPAGIWWATDQTLQCYCLVMRLETWSQKEPHAITQCDGQLQAIAKLEAEMAKDAG